MLLDLTQAVMTGAIHLPAIDTPSVLVWQGGAKCLALPFGLCPRLWDSGHVPAHEVDDIAIYGSGLGRREHWPAWLLVHPLLHT